MARIETVDHYQSYGGGPNVPYLTTSLDYGLPYGIASGTGTASMNFIAYANEAANGNDFENRYLISEAINAKRMLQILFFFFFFKFCVNSVSKCLPFSSGRRFYFRPVPPSIPRGLAGYQTAGCPLNPTRSGLKSSRITCSIRKSLILL